MMNEIALSADESMYLSEKIFDAAFALAEARPPEPGGLRMTVTVSARNFMQLVRQTGAKVHGYDTKYPLYVEVPTPFGITRVSFSRDVPDEIVRVVPKGGR